MVERARWQLDAWVNSAGAHQPASPCCGSSRSKCAATMACSWACGAGAPRPTSGRREPLPGWRRWPAPEQVLVPAATGGRLPGDAFAWVPAVTADLAEPAQRLTPARRAMAGQPAEPVAGSGVCRTAGDRGARRQGTPRACHWQGSGQRCPGNRATQHEQQRPVEPIVAWAGPWPLEERWWDATRARRSARFQLLTGVRIAAAGLPRAAAVVAARRLLLNACKMSPRPSKFAC